MNEINRMVFPIAQQGISITQILKNVRLIQGGMGVYISHWKLARAAALSKPGIVAGTVSGTALNIVYSRMLQLGDPGGHIKQAFQALDSICGLDMGKRVYERYYIDGGKKSSVTYKQSIMSHVRFENGTSQIAMPAGEGMHPVRLILDDDLIELFIASAFAEVWLAKKGHNGLIFINFLRKIELPLIYSIFGAMLAGVDGVVMGAGNPDGFPQICSMLSQYKEVIMEPAVLYKEVGEKFYLSFNPKKYFSTMSSAPSLKRPVFLAIVSLEDLATALAKSESEPPDGLIIENYKAGGHNANPIGPLKKDNLDQPIYGEKDVADLNVIKNIGLPFWLGGGFDSRLKLQEALNAGANGIQAGSIYAFAEESGMSADHHETILRKFKNGNDDKSIVRTTMFSPTGFAFKVAFLDGTLSDQIVYEKRRRVCDMGVLHQIGLDKPDEKGMRRIFHRCSAAPVELFVKNRGLIRNTEERRCICNGLIAGMGCAQVVKDIDGILTVEPSIITLGENLDGVRRMSDNGNHQYNCADIASDILGDN
jgi:nitronate monooxygenase